MLCKTYDTFIDEKAVWVAKLSDGSFVYQDDYRPGETIPIAWLRLKKYLETEKEISIIGLHFRFRSNIIHPLPENSDGYFFSNKIIQPLSKNKVPPFNFFVGGYLENKVINRVTIKIPEMDLVARDIKPQNEEYDYYCIRRR
jgi:hypothetical protein